jgi:hypothetical protein
MATSARIRAPPDHDQVVGGVLHLAHQVRGQEHRAALGGQVLQQGADPDDAVGVQPVDRLVQHDHGRIGQQRGGDAQPLAHTQREGAGPLAGDVGEPDQLQQVVHPLGADAHGGAHGQQVVAGGAALVYCPGLQQRPDLSQGGGRVEVAAAVDGHLPGGRAGQAQHGPHGGGLPGPVRPQECGHDARPHDEADVVDGDGVAVALGELIDLDHCRLLARNVSVLRR